MIGIKSVVEKLLVFFLLSILPTLDVSCYVVNNRLHPRFCLIGDRIVHLPLTIQKLNSIFLDWVMPTEANLCQFDVA